MKNKLYLVSGVDAKADNGYWEVVVEAVSMPQARSRVADHLVVMNRRDLIGSEGSIGLLKDRPIIHSTVESR